MKNPEQRIEQFGTMSDDMAAMLQVTPEFIEEWAPTTVIYPLGGQQRPNVTSFSIEDGVVKDGLSNPSTPYTRSLVDRLEAFDDALCWSGLYYLASPSARGVKRFGSPEAPFGGPYEPERARLTGGLMESVRAAQQIGGLAAEHLEPKSVRIAEKRVKRLAKTVIAVTFNHPEKIFLATETPTQEQLDAAESLIPVLGRRDRKNTAKLLDDAGNGKIAEPIDKDKWQDELRRWHVKWLSQEEYEEEQRGLDEFFTLVRENLRREREA